MSSPLSASPVRVTLPGPALLGSLCVLEPLAVSSPANAHQRRHCGGFVSFALLFVITCLCCLFCGGTVCAQYDCEGWAGWGADIGAVGVRAWAREGGAVWGAGSGAVSVVSWACESGVGLGAGISGAGISAAGVDARACEGGAVWGAGSGALSVASWACKGVAVLSADDFIALSVDAVLVGVVNCSMLAFLFLCGVFARRFGLFASSTLCARAFFSSPSSFIFFLLFIPGVSASSIDPLNTGGIAAAAAAVFVAGSLVGVGDAAGGDEDAGSSANADAEKTLNQHFRFMIGSVAAQQSLRVIEGSRIDAMTLPPTSTNFNFEPLGNSANLSVQRAALLKPLAAAGRALRAGAAALSKTDSFLRASLFHEDDEYYGQGDGPSGDGYSEADGFESAAAAAAAAKRASNLEQQRETRAAALRSARNQRRLKTNLSTASATSEHTSGLLRDQINCSGSIHQLLTDPAPCTKCHSSAVTVVCETCCRSSIRLCSFCDWYIHHCEGGGRVCVRWALRAVAGASGLSVLCAERVAADALLEPLKLPAAPSSGLKCSLREGDGDDSPFAPQFQLERKLYGEGGVVRARLLKAWQAALAVGAPASSPTSDAGSSVHPAARLRGPIALALPVRPASVPCACGCSLLWPHAWPLQTSMLMYGIGHSRYLSAYATSVFCPNCGRISDTSSSSATVNASAVPLTPAKPRTWLERDVLYYYVTRTSITPGGWIPGRHIAELLRGGPSPHRLPSPNLNTFSKVLRNYLSANVFGLDSVRGLNTFPCICCGKRPPKLYVDGFQKATLYETPEMEDVAFSVAGSTFIPGSVFTALYSIPTVAARRGQRASANAGLCGAREMSAATESLGPKKAKVRVHTLVCNVCADGCVFSHSEKPSFEKLMDQVVAHIEALLLLAGQVSDVSCRVRSYIENLQRDNPTIATLLLHALFGGPLRTARFSFADAPPGSINKPLSLAVEPMGTTGDAHICSCCSPSQPCAPTHLPRHFPSLPEAAFVSTSICCLGGLHTYQHDPGCQAKTGALSDPRLGLITEAAEWLGGVLKESCKLRGHLPLPVWRLVNEITFALLRSQKDANAARRLLRLWVEAREAVASQRLAFTAALEAAEMDPADAELDAKMCAASEKEARGEAERETATKAESAALDLLEERSSLRARLSTLEDLIRAAGYRGASKSRAAPTEVQCKRYLAAFLQCLSLSADDIKAAGTLTDALAVRDRLTQRLRELGSVDVDISTGDLLGQLTRRLRLRVLELADCNKVIDKLRKKGAALNQQKRRYGDICNSIRSDRHRLQGLCDALPSAEWAAAKAWAVRLRAAPAGHKLPLSVFVGAPKEIGLGAHEDSTLRVVRAWRSYKSALAQLAHSVAAPAAALDNASAVKRGLLVQLDATADAAGADLAAAVGGARAPLFVAAGTVAGGGPSLIALGDEGGFNAVQRERIAYGLRVRIAEGLQLYSALETQLVALNTAQALVQGKDPDALLLARVKRDASGWRVLGKQLLDGSLRDLAGAPLSVADAAQRFAASLLGEQPSADATAPAEAAAEPGSDGGSDFEELTDSSDSSSTSGSDSDSGSESGAGDGRRAAARQRADSECSAGDGRRAAKRRRSDSESNAEGGPRTAKRGRAGSASGAVDRWHARALPPLPPPHLIMYHLPMRLDHDYVFGLPRKLNENTCWANALAQLLSASPALADAMKLVSVRVRTAGEPNAGAPGNAARDKALAYLFFAARAAGASSDKVRDAAGTLLVTWKEIPAAQYDSVEALSKLRETVPELAAVLRYDTRTTSTPLDEHAADCAQRAPHIYPPSTNSSVLNECSNSEATEACSGIGARASAGTDAAPNGGAAHGPSAWSLAPGVPVPTAGTPSGEAVSLLALLKYLEYEVTMPGRCDAQLIGPKGVPVKGCGAHVRYVRAHTFFTCPEVLVVPNEQRSRVWAPTALRLQPRSAAGEMVPAPVDYVLCFIVLRSGGPVRRQFGAFANLGHFMGICVRSGSVADPHLVVDDDRVSEAQPRDARALALQWGRAYVYVRQRAAAPLPLLEAEEEVAAAAGAAAPQMAAPSAAAHKHGRATAADSASNAAATAEANALAALLPPLLVDAVATDAADATLCSELLLSIPLLDKDAPVPEDAAAAFERNHFLHDCFRWNTMMGDGAACDYISLLCNSLGGCYTFLLMHSPDARRGSRAFTYAEPDLLVKSIFKSKSGAWAQRDFFDVTTQRFVFFPMSHDSAHFTVVAFNVACNTITHYDLLGRGPGPVATDPFLALTEGVLRSLWCKLPAPRSGAPRTATNFNVTRALPPLDLAVQGKNYHCGAIAGAVVECLLRAGVPPLLAGVRAAEEAQWPHRVVEDGNTFWGAYRRRMAIALVRGELPEDVEAYGAALQDRAAVAAAAERGGRA